MSERGSREGSARRRSRPGEGLTKEERKQERKRRKLQSFQGYTNEDNPFNDPNLHATFVWKKKKAALKREGKAVDDSRAAQLRKREEALREIEVMSKRRQEREAEREERERQRLEEERLRDFMQNGDYERRADEFHARQVRDRSRLRLQDGREQPIDELARHVVAGDVAEGARGRGRAPDETVAGLALDDLRRLAEEAAAHALTALAEGTAAGEQGPAELPPLDDGADAPPYGPPAESPSAASAYWADVRRLIRWYTLRAEAEVESGGGGGGGRLHAEVEAEVERRLAGQDAAGLRAVHSEAVDRQRERARADGDFWAAVERRAAAELARERLRAATGFSGVRRTAAEAAEAAEAETARRRAEAAARRRAAAAGSTSDLDALLRPEDTAVQDDEAGVSTVENLRAEAGADGIAPGEVGPDGLRKPRYIAKIRTGYRWTRYNKSRYTLEAPPPKAVQGYSFVVVYTDLPPGLAPTFQRTPVNKQFETIRFSAPSVNGKPIYRDIAFQIVRGEWMIGRNSGYRSVFERGVLKLNFRFTEARYRK